MKMLQEKTKQNLEYLLGVSLNELDGLDLDAELEHIENRSKKSISFSKKRDKRKVGRGNPLLSRKRYRTMSKVNQGLDKIK